MKYLRLVKLYTHSSDVWKSKQNRIVSGKDFMADDLTVARKKGEPPMT